MTQEEKINHALSLLKDALGISTNEIVWKDAKSEKPPIGTKVGVITTDECIMIGSTYNGTFLKDIVGYFEIPAIPEWLKLKLNTNGKKK